MAGWARDRLQYGGRPRLESRHEITGLCWLLSGWYVAKSTEKYPANIIRLSTSKPLILAKPGPSQGLKQPFEHPTPPRRSLLKPASSSLSSTEGQN